MPDNAVKTSRDSFVGGGSTASRLLSSGMNVNALRTNDTLRKDEWIQFDEAVVEEAAIRLRGVRDLMDAGLTFNLQNALGTTIVQWEDVEDMQPAVKSMDGATRGLLDRQEFNLNSIPVYITHKDFRLSIRHLEASRRLGESIDTTQARTSARLVSESIENDLFDGAGVTVDNNTAYGYTNHPDRNTGTLTGDWSDTSAVNGTDIIDDVLSMISDAEGDRFFGPYWLYLPTNFSARLENDFKANSDRTIRERLEAIDPISAVRVADQLNNNNVVLVQATRDVVDLVSGLEPQTVQWETDGGMIVNFKVMAIQVPRIKSDAQGRSGVVHYST